MINLHIIGVQKAGTTALASFLNQHPDVYVVDGKEAHIFDHPNYALQANPQAWARRKYKEKLSGYKGEKITCDATPITLFQSRFLNACYQFNPEAKFIVMLRDPVDRAISQYHMSRKNKQETRCQLSAFGLESWRLRHIDQEASWPFDSPYRNHSYLSRGLYSKQLEAMYKLIPSTQILVLHQEQLMQNHDETLLSVYQFLDIHRHKVTAKKVFSTENQSSHWSDPLARAYAKTVFRLRGETPAKWQKIIDENR